MIEGIHHITGAVRGAQRDLDFYTGVLGFRLIKKTVNQETTDDWHFFYGDYEGNPGTIMTNIFIPEDVPLPEAVDGRGTIDALSYSVSPNSLDYWKERLTDAGYACEEMPERFGDPLLHFRDPSGLSSEMVGNADDDRTPGLDSDVPAEHQIKGFHGATLNSRIPELSIDFFQNSMGFEIVGQEGNRTRLAVNGGGPGKTIDILDDKNSPWGKFGLGSIHHVAFTVPSLEALEMMWRILSGAGIIVTEARDRGWFHSNYFNEPGGIALEFSNLDPGWTFDEEMDSLGTILSLPNHLEPRRSEIEGVLYDVDFSRA